MRVLVLVGAFALPACLWGDFGDVDDTAPVRAYAFGEYEVPTGFGLALETLGDGQVLASAGAGTEHGVFTVWDAAESTPGPRVPAFDGCGPDRCDAGAGVDYAFLGDLMETVDGQVNVRPNCFAISSRSDPDDSGTDGRVRVQCDGAQTVRSIDSGIRNVGFGRSIATARFGANVALIGAPEGAAGALYAFPEDGFTFDSVTVDEALALSDGDGFGSAIETMPSAGGVWALVASGDAARVSLLRVDASLAAETEGCIDGVQVRDATAAPSEGGSMLLADLNGDGTPEVVLGDTQNGRVLIVPGDALDASGCATRDASVLPAGTQTLTCAELSLPGCAGLGSALSAGDFDGDGDLDLAVGASETPVDGSEGAGAFVVLFQESGAFGGAQSGFATLRSPDRAEGLGTRLAAVPAGGRDVVVASAPGRNAILAFFCDAGFGGPGICQQ
ncbi:MAG: hypothetical protein AAF411_19995 [Myxococcota bacterium]